MREVKSELQMREELLKALVPRQIAKKIQTEENRQVGMLLRARTMLQWAVRRTCRPHACANI